MDFHHKHLEAPRKINAMFFKNIPWKELVNYTLSDKKEEVRRILHSWDLVPWRGGTVVVIRLVYIFLRIINERWQNSSSHLPPFESYGIGRLLSRHLFVHTNISLQVYKTGDLRPKQDFPLSFDLFVYSYSNSLSALSNKPQPLYSCSTQ